MHYNETEKWHDFSYRGRNYDLSHLNAKKLSFTDPKNGKTYTFFVTYSFHCFAKDSDDLTLLERQELMYSAPRDKRPFHFERYHDSTKLPEIINNLPNCHTFDAGYEKSALIHIFDESGRKIYYKIVFKAYREEKKLRLHIETAHRVSSLEKTKPRGFFVIAKNALLGKPLKSNP